MKTFTPFLFLLIGFLLVTSCQKDQPKEFLKEEYDILSEHLNLPEEDFDYSVTLPNHLFHFFPENTTNERDIVRDAQATLGRVIFYDTRLSANQTVSCATCHDQKKGFGDNEVLSEGFNGEVGHRNSIALATTVGFETSYGGEGERNGGPVDFGPIVQFSWDDMTPDLMQQSKQAIESEVEMGMNISEVVERMKNEEFYGILFKRAFDNLEINEDKVLLALQVFINSIASVDTKFDRALDKDGLLDPFQDVSSFTTQENLGKLLFNNNCTTCHSLNHAMTFNPIANNGLDLEYADQGKGAKTGLEQEMGIFKIPFLRNIALTAPYMHDGRFSTLEEVIDHYSEEIKLHRNLSPALKEYSPAFPEGRPRKMNFSSEEKDALVAYLNTLTDLSLAKDERYSDPFKR
jgi:cytochrome c peroxidase